MKLVLDQGLPRGAVRGLCEAGHDAVHVGELGMSRSTDTSISALAAEQGRVVVTLDSDFAKLLAVSRASGPSVIHLRLQHLDVAATGALLLRVLPEVEQDLESGAVVSVSKRGVRVRPLPL